MTWKCQRLPNGRLSFEVNQLAAASVSTEKFNLGLPGNQLQLWVSEEDPLKLDSSPVHYSLNLSLVVHRLWWEQRERAKERESSFLFSPSLPASTRRVTKRTGDDSATWLHNNSLCTDPPPPLRKKSGRETLFPIFFWGAGCLYRGYTITILYNVFVVD